MSGWRDRAACRYVSPEQFFPIQLGGHEEQSAKQVCAGCPVLDPCRDMAVNTNLLPYGIAGGLNEYERADLRAQRAERVTAR